MLGLSSKVVITLDFLGEIYSSAAKNLDFMRVCESVVMNIGTTPAVSKSHTAGFASMLKHVGNNAKRCFLQKTAR